MQSSTQPLVSILMLTFNRENYICEAIDSVLTQTYQNWELLILDDGSTDKTVEVISKYKNDVRIKYFADPVNKGLQEKRKESLGFATAGTYVAILDSDDVWTDNNKLQRQVFYLNEHPECAVVGTSITLVDAQGVTFGSNSYNTSDATIRKQILIRNQFAHSSVMMRKSMLDKTSGYRDFAPTEDLDLFLQLGQFGTFANLSEPMLGYRVHKKGESAIKAKVIRRVLRIISIHKHEYPNYLVAVIKFRLMLLLSVLGLRK